MALLLQGDCLQVMKDLSANSIDCFICDLPYGCLMGGGGKEKAKRKNIGKAASNKQAFGGSPSGGLLGVDWDIKIDLVEFWKQVKRLAKNEHTPVLMFCTTRFGAELIASNPSWFRYDLVWSKTNAVGFLCANKMPMRGHEMIYVFSKAGAYYKRVDISGNFPGGGGGPRNNANCYISKKEETNHKIEAGRRCPTSVVTIANKKERGAHPTAKPIALYEWLITRYCPTNGVILDPTAGSFNSVRAALNLNRKAIGIEKDSGFFKKAQDSREWPSFQPSTNPSASS